MVTVSIVEDEYPINDKIRKILLTMNDRIKIVGQYLNGLEALNAYEQNGYPDIIISDICMPNVSGIELAQKIRNKSSQTQIIMISGYSDFEYTKQAIELKAAQYLLKPIKVNELVFSIEKCIAIMNDNLKNASMIEDQQMYILRQLVFGRTWGLRQSGIRVKPSSLKYDFYLLVVFQNCSDDPMLFPGFTLDVENIVNEFDIRDSFFPYFDEGGEKRFHVVIGSNDIVSLKDTAGRILEKISAVYDADIKICYSASGKETLTLLKDLNDTSFYGRFVSDKLIFTQCDATDDRNEYTTLQQELYDEFIRLSSLSGQISSSRMRNELVSAAVAAFSGENLRRCGLRNIKDRFIEFFRYLYSLLNKITVDKIDMINSYILSGQILDDFDDNKQLINFICGFIDSAVSVEGEGGSGSGIIEKAKQLIYDNYANPDFSLSAAAEKLFLNPSYLSRVFKEATGSNFSYFTNNVKIEKAKQLLDTTNKDILEISFEVGYNNQQYFSRIFKNFTGSAPNSYRQRAR